MPEYIPEEGVDYMIDYYHVIGVSPDAGEKEIKKAIDKKQREYHPDRLQDTAPEFQARGHHMAELLNRARRMLVDPEKRAQYDALFNDWDGLVSISGEAVMTPSLYFQRKMATSSMDEIEASLKSDDERVGVHIRDASSRVAFLEKMMEPLEDNVPAEFRTQYEEALLEQDRSLAIRLSMREDLLGITNGVQKRQDRIAPGYSEEVTASLETAKSQTLTELRARVLAGTAEKLALLSGEATTESTKAPLDVLQVSLPTYFGPVSDQIQDLAIRRSEIVEKRLENMQVDYPEAEQQATLQPRLILGFKDQPTYPWLAFTADMMTLNFEQIDLPDGFTELLIKGSYEAVIREGYNIVLVPVLDQIDLSATINEGLNKLYQKYAPDEE